MAILYLCVCTELAISLKLLVLSSRVYLPPSAKVSTNSAVNVSFFIATLVSLSLALRISILLILSRFAKECQSVCKLSPQESNFTAKVNAHIIPDTPSFHLPIPRPFLLPQTLQIYLVMIDKLKKHVKGLRPSRKIQYTRQRLSRAKRMAKPASNGSNDSFEDLSSPPTRDSRSTTGRTR